ncbi:MAG: class I SAM-dependent methyltransferase [Saprospiraceae bacterium]
MKDNFSAQASTYARHRPTYPAQLYDFLYAHTPAFNCAWDCATGNGQVARVLAETFEQVEATDISVAQINNAPALQRIRYQVAPAENSGLPDACCDLITVGQAAHWFDRPAFYAEANRCLNPGGLLALFGYGICTIDEDTDALIHHLYENILGVYWDPERRYVDEGYASFDFPFAEIPFPTMFIETQWTVADALGFLDSWSALQHFIRLNGHSPLNSDFQKKLAVCWAADEVKMVRFPMFGRIGKSLDTPFV